jgi:hypothetical protein
MTSGRFVVGFAGTKFVIVSFPAGQHLLQSLLAWLGGLPAPTGRRRAS